MGPTVYLLYFAASQMRIPFARPKSPHIVDNIHVHAATRVGKTVYNLCSRPQARFGCELKTVTNSGGRRLHSSHMWQIEFASPGRRHRTETISDKIQHDK